MENLFGNAYPYLDEHELNLDWIIAKMKELIKDFNEFKVVNNITFSGEWDITKNYPAWTIVSDNNIGYVSIKPVPSGVVLTNTDYWIEVIDYTAQIAGLENRVIALEGDMFTAQNDISTLQGEVGLLTKPNYILCSDSYGVMSTWITEFINIMGLTSDDYVNVAMNAAAFEPQGNDTFYNQLNRASLQVADANKVTDIIIIGGLNDTYNAYTDTGQLFSAMQSCDTYAKATYPNAKIHLGFVGMLDRDQTAAPGTDMQRIQYTMIRYIDYANQLGWHYFNNIEYALHGVNLMQADGVHPNSDGGKRIAQYVVQALKTGSCDVKTYLGGTTHLSVDNPTNYTFGTYFDMTNYEVDNGMTTFNINTFRLTSSGVSTNFSNIQLTIPCHNLPFVGNTTSDTYVEDAVALVSYDGGSKSCMVPAKLQLSGSNFILSIKAFNWGEANWQTQTIVAIETMYPVKFVLPTSRI